MSHFKTHVSYRTSFVQISTPTPNMTSSVCKRTNSHPKLRLNVRTTLIWFYHYGRRLFLSFMLKWIGTSLWGCFNLWYDIDCISGYLRLKYTWVRPRHMILKMVVYSPPFTFSVFCFLRQKADRSTLKHRRQVDHLASYLSRREEISEPGIERPTSSLKVVLLFYFDINPRPLNHKIIHIHNKILWDWQYSKEYF